jgi:hypothetical protein
VSDARTPFGRVVLVGLLVIATLGFGLAGLCGGVFTVMALPEVVSPPKHGSFAGAILFISVPSLLVGGLLAWLCVRKLIRMSGSKD